MESHKRGKVLLVDDIKANVNILKVNLKIEYDINVAYDGEGALEQVVNNPPDLILLDIEMPGIDGYEVCRRLKMNKDTENIPIVFITSKNDEEDETKGLEIGAIDYITKPFSIPIVKARVKNLMQLKKQQDILENLSTIDGLTGIPNRRRFDQVLDQEWRRAMRSKKTMSMIMIDIDCFKKYNDFYGHAAGDECLRAVARSLTGSLKRPLDFVARYGGEEFVVVLPDTDIAGAFSIGESMRLNVKGLRIPHQESTAGDYVTISAGIANIVPKKEQSPEKLIQNADNALYEAKKESRDTCKINDSEKMAD